jgi:alpha-tubulin suppressor-like RCC1 family protein
MAINKVKFKSGGEDLSDIYLSTEEAGDRLDDGSIPSSILTPEGVQALLARSLWAWGDNDTVGVTPNGGELGLNNVINRSSPVQVGTLTNWREIADRLATKTDGTLWGWGPGANGASGLGDTIARSSPAQVGTNTDWVKASSGGQLSFAITNSSTLWSWGSGTMGALGRNSTGTFTTPGQVGTLSNWKDVVGNAYDIAFTWPGQVGRLTQRRSGWATALKTDGTLWAWGSPFNEAFDNVVYFPSPVITGITGLNSTIARSSPVQVGTDTDWKEIGTGIAIKTNGTLWIWGGSGALALNSTVSKSSPTQVGTDTDWKKISRVNGGAIKNNGTLWMWSTGSGGRLGLNDTITRSSPVQVGALTNWKSINAGSYVIALKTDGTLWSWGTNTSGSLGLGDTINRSSPVQVGALTDWKKLDRSGAARVLK